jgi:hypothetical protein
MTGGPWTRYGVVEPFFARPRRMTFVEVADIDVDDDDNVYLLTRGRCPVMVFTADGEFAGAWGGTAPGDFAVPHGLTLGPDGFVYTVDVGMHVVRKWTRTGRLLLSIGTPFQNSQPQSGVPFNKPSNVAVTADGAIYVSDGYGNSSVHKFDARGRYEGSFGTHGVGRGQFDLLHGISLDQVTGDRLYCADRSNNRVQSFTPNGEFAEEWTDLRLPNCAVRAADGRLYVAELGNRVSVFDGHRLVARWGEENATYGGEEISGGLPTSPSRRPMLRAVVPREPGAGRLMMPHAIAVDSRGSVYVGEVAETLLGVDRGDRSVQKFVPVPEKDETASAADAAGTGRPPASGQHGSW